MALNKVTYVDGTTVIHSSNLNAIQDEIIANAANITTNTSNISTNTSNISELSGDIEDITTEIGEITEAVADNTEDIATNTAAIATKEAIGKITIDGTEYEAVISNVDAGEAGKIVFYIEE